MLSFNNFKNKMQPKQGQLFTLDLRIRQQRIKLSVHQSDSLNDLLQRLASKANLNQKYSEMVKQKLENGLRSIADSPACSENVRNKLQELTEESKIIILGVSQDHTVEQSLNETPFKILLEASGNFRKHSVGQARRNYLQEGEDSPALKRNYNVPISQIIYERQDAENYDSYPKQRVNMFSTTTFNPIYSNAESPEKNFKKYGCRAGKEISKNYSPLSDINRPFIQNSQKHNEHNGKTTVGSIRMKCTSSGYPQLKDYQFVRKSEIFQSSFNQSYRSQDKQSRQQSQQYLRMKYYTSNQQQSLIPKDYINQQQYTPNLINNYKTRYFEDKNMYPDKKFCYLENEV